MLKKINPTDIAPPVNAYNHAFAVSSPAAMMFLSGQLGERPDGTCAKGVEAQARQAWENVRRILQDGGMGFENITKVVSYIVGSENIRDYAAVHQELHRDVLPPWTLVVVQALGRPHYVVEIDVIAAA